MSQPLLSAHEVGAKVDLTHQRKGRLCLRSGEKIETCPSCKRRGMRRLMMDGRIRYVHVVEVTDINYKPLDACTMWQRTEFILRYGYDGLHHILRKPGDDNQTVEEIR